MINSLKNHIRAAGANGWYTFNAGYHATEVNADLALEVMESTKQTLKAGDWVFIRGYDRPLEILFIHGVIVTLDWNEAGIDFRDYYALDIRKKGRYSYGTVRIHKAHLIKI